ncbi:flagellar basal body rod protein FlgB [Gallaecimonas sp. GXIMD4217]|uniref:flagellar basal body rod protein FlgB n=1 Tax=Gallaecimonas sp. GXIMD4217 TaxID=3131927 RepID=UPI00311B430C
MAISFDKAFGIHQHALTLRTERAELIAGNIANADTPGYKAKAMDFKAALAAAQAGQSGTSLSRTDSRHLAATSTIEAATAYRLPTQPDTGDGNSVDLQLERSLYMQNAMEYQASLRFLNGKIKGLLTAIKGE